MLINVIIFLRISFNFSNHHNIKYNILKNLFKILNLNKTKFNVNLTQNQFREAIKYHICT